MEVQLLRKNGKGIQGTYDNAYHHAQDLIPVIKKIESRIQETQFASWRQGHNVHAFRTKDGREFRLRAVRNNSKYVGIKLTIKIKRGLEKDLAFFYVDNRNDLSSDEFCTIIKACSEPPYESEVIGKEANE